jgi:hypothetical protein
MKVSYDRRQATDIVVKTNLPGIRIEWSPHWSGLKVLYVVIHIRRNIAPGRASIIPFAIAFGEKDSRPIVNE